MTQTQNPNWPRMDVAVAFHSGPRDGMPYPYWLSLNNRTDGQITTNRGRQYELDQVQTGTWAGILENTDAALDPSNTASPYYPKVLPYRAFRHRAQWPVNANLLTPDQATSFYATQGAGGAGSTLPQWIAGFNGSPTTVVHVGGGNRYRSTINVGDIYQGTTAYGWSVKPGQTYTVSAVCTVSGGTASVLADIYFYDASGSVISNPTVPGFSVGTQVQLSYTATAPANAAGGKAIFITDQNPSTFAGHIDLWNLQVEEGSSMTSWVTPGTWYPIFNGYVERWPQTWAFNGMHGHVSPVAVDAFGYLSQRKLMTSFYDEVMLLSPAWFYPLDESNPPQPGVPIRFHDYSSQRRPSKLRNPTSSPVSKASPAQQLLATGGWLPGGIGGPVLEFGSDQANTNQIGSQYLDLTCGDEYPSGPATQTWTRMFAFRAPQFSTLHGAVAQVAVIGRLDGGTRLQVSAIYDGSGNFGNNNGNGLEVTLWQGGVNTAAWAVNSAVNNNMSDGGWHLLIFGKAGRTIFGWYDGNPMYTVTTGGLSNNVTFPDTGDSIGGDPAGDIAAGGLEVTCVAEFPTQLTDAQASQLYSTFRYGGSGLGSASSADRYSDILRWGKWAGLQAEDRYTTGQTTNYGPASELTTTAGSAGTDVVTALQTVVDTESGTHYVAVDGTVTFKARRARYNQGTPVVTFGENTGAGEVPYTNVELGYDNTRIANDITVTQTQTQAAVRATDGGSANSYGDIELQRTVNTLDDEEQTDAAHYLLNRNAQPLQRVERISVNVGANPNLWAQLLPLEFGTRVRVMRRPPLGAATIQVDGFVEQINWTFDNKGNAYLDLQISNNNKQQYWQLDDSTYSVLDSTTIIGY
jgi:hypothetical protein